jgi:hypothetical protein
MVSGLLNYLNPQLRIYSFLFDKIDDGIIDFNRPFELGKVPAFRQHKQLIIRDFIRANLGSTQSGAAMQKRIRNQVVILTKNYECWLANFTEFVDHRLIDHTCHRFCNGITIPFKVLCPRAGQCGL